MPRKGIVLLLAAALAFSVMSVFVKLAGQRLPAQMLIFFRALFSLIVTFAWLRMHGTPLTGKYPGFLILRGLFGTVALMCFFTSLTRLPLAEVSLLFAMHPIFVSVLAAYFLKESPSPRLGVALALALTGVFFVLGPDALTLAPESRAHALAMGVTLFGALCAAFAYVIIRRIAPEEDAWRILLYFPLIAVPLTLPGVLTHWITPTPLEWLYILGIGVFVQMAQLFLTLGLALVEVGPATTVGYAQVIFAALFGALVFGEIPAPNAISGAVIIGVAILLLTAQSPRRSLTPGVSPLS